MINDATKAILESTNGDFVGALVCVMDTDGCIAVSVSGGQEHVPELLAAVEEFINFQKTPVSEREESHEH